MRAGCDLVLLHVGTRNAFTEAVEAMEKYGAVSSVPITYVIDREGKVVDAWCGYDKGDTRAIEALRETGLEIEETTHQE